MPTGGFSGQRPIARAKPIPELPDNLRPREIGFVSGGQICHLFREFGADSLAGFWRVGVRDPKVQGFDGFGVFWRSEARHLTLCAV